MDRPFEWTDNLLVQRRVTYFWGNTQKAVLYDFVGSHFVGWCVHNSTNWSLKDTFYKGSNTHFTINTNTRQLVRHNIHHADCWNTASCSFTNHLFFTIWSAPRLRCRHQNQMALLPKNRRAYTTWSLPSSIHTGNHSDTEHTRKPEVMPP